MWRMSTKSLHVYGQQGVLSRALSVGRYSLLLDDAEWLSRYLERLEALSPRAVFDVLGKYLGAEHRVEMHVVARGVRS